MSFFDPTTLFSRFGGFRLALYVPLRPLWYLNLFFSLRDFLVIHKEVLGCSVVFHGSKISFFVLPILGLHLPILFTRTFCGPNLKKNVGTFATLVCVCTYCGREPHTASGGNMRDQTAIPTVNPWFFLACVFSLRQKKPDQIWSTVGSNSTKTSHSQAFRANRRAGC